MNTIPSGYMRLAKIACFMASVTGLVPIIWAQPDGGYSTWSITPFAGYQWARERGDVVLYPPPGGAGSSGGRAFGNRLVAGARVTQDFHKYIGLEQSFTWARLPADYTAWVSGRPATLDATSYKLTLNPVFHFKPRESRIRPFATAGVTANWFDPGSDTLLYPQPTVGGLPTKTRLEAALMYGAGIKMHLSRRIGLRFDVRDHLSKTPHFTIPDFPSAPGFHYSPKGQMLHQIEVSGGIIFRFGYREPPPPPAPPPSPPPPPPPPEAPKPSFSVNRLSASATDICPGPTVELKADTTGIPADATYRWTLNGAPIRATGATASVPTTGLSGNQEVVLTVESGGVTRTAKTSFTIKPTGNPTINVSASPTTVQRGQNATLTITAKASECGGNVSSNCTASEGTVTGTTYNSSSVAFDPAATRAQSKTVTITCNATNSIGGGTATATTRVTVTERPSARRLDDLVFAKGSGRVNNCAKRLLLEELTPLLRDNPDWTVVLVGHRDEQEPANLDRVRAQNAAAVISAGTGICPSLELNRVKIDTVGTNQSSTPRPAFCGASTGIKERSGQGVTETDNRAQFRRVEVWVVPAGAEMPEGLRNAKDAPVEVIKKLGCPR